MQVLYWPVLGRIQFCRLDRRRKTCLDTKPVLYQDMFCSCTYVEQQYMTKQPLDPYAWTQHVLSLDGHSGAGNKWQSRLIAKAYENTIDTMIIGHNLANTFWVQQVQFDLWNVHVTNCYTLKVYVYICVKKKQRLKLIVAHQEMKQMC